MIFSKSSGLGLAIIPAQIHEAKALIELQGRALRGGLNSHYKLEEIERWARCLSFENLLTSIHSGEVLVAKDGENIVGFGHLKMEWSEIKELHVEPTLFRSGIGSKLVNALEILAKKSDLTELKLFSTLNAAPFYRKCGFEGENIKTLDVGSGLNLPFVFMSKVMRH